jgi:translation elongation factor EF-1beta
VTYNRVVLDVKVWEAEQDLMELFRKITSEIVIDGLLWAEGCNIVPVAFGVKKLVISCVIEDDKVGVNDITDPIEAMEDLVQSVSYTYHTEH